jgi:hypothetical protein
MNNHFNFCGKSIDFIKYSNRYSNSASFLVSNEFLEEVKSISEISGKLSIFKDRDWDVNSQFGSFKREYDNCMISRIYEDTNVYGKFEVTFNLNIPIDIIREFKLKKILDK